MIDFDLNEGNLKRQDIETVEVMGARVKVEYRLHVDEFPDPEDPVGTPITLWCMHVPQINQTYVDESEELVFEALHEFFQEDLVRYYAMRMNEIRDREKAKKEENKDG